MTPRLWIAGAAAAGALAVLGIAYMAGHRAAVEDQARQKAEDYRSTRERIDDAADTVPDEPDALDRLLRQLAGE